MAAMGTVLRILGIVVASMILGLVGLFLLIFSICGGLKTSEGGGILMICLALIVACVGAIVFLGRGISAARTAAKGLAVPPAATPYGYAAPDAGAPGAYTDPESPGYAMPAEAAQMPGAPTAGAPSVPARPARPVLPPRTAAPLGGTDLQVLIGLRIALAVYILFSVGSMVFNLANFGRFGSNVAIQLVVRSILNMLPTAAVLLVVSLRNPPAGGAVDAAAGLGIASVLFRVGYLTFSGLFTSGFIQMTGVSSLILRLGAFSALEMTIAGLALRVRSRLGPMNPVSLIAAIVGFLFWDGLVQAIMQALTTLLF